MTEEKLSLRIELQGEYRKMFDQIKKDYMFQNNTDALRYCIKETVQRSALNLNEEFVELIRRYLKNDNVKIKYSIFNVDDFVKKSIEYLIADIDKNQESIKSWDIRSNLNEEEVEIALAFIDCQSNNDNNQVTLHELMQILNLRNSNRVEETLNDFVNRGILSLQVNLGQKFYHAK